MLHHLEAALQDEINLRHIDTSIVLTKLIAKGGTSAKLTSLDEKNRSFLMLAVENYLFLVADELINHCENKEIIFQLDDDERSVFWYAAKMGMNDIFERLFNIAQTYVSSDPKDKVWFRDDSENASPLVMALKNNHFGIAHLILDALQLEPNSRDLINKTHNGQTIFYSLLVSYMDQLRDKNLFLSTESLQLIKRFIEIGADIDLRNDDGTKASQLICELPFNPLLQIYQQGSEQVKTEILLAFKERMTKENQPMMQENYVKLAGLMSLLDMFTAQNDISGAAETPMKSLNGQGIFVAPKAMVKRHSAYKNLEVDRVNLFSLARETDILIRDLQGRPNTPMASKAAYVAILILYFLALGAMSFGLYEPRKKIKDDFFNTLYLAVYLSVVPFLIILGGFVWSMVHSVLTSEKEISHTERRDFLRHLKQDVIEKINILESHHTDTEPLLPTDARTIADIKEVADSLTRDHLRVQTIDIFTRLKELLTILQKDMCKTNHPLTLFSQPEVVIKMDDEPSKRLRLT